MPKKLTDCVKKVEESGKTESESWAICTDSTGLKKEKHEEKKAEIIQRLVSLANHLDEISLPEEADALDNTLQKEAQFKWLKEKKDQFKNWVQTEKETDKDTRSALTQVRQNHWELVKQINDALKDLSNAHKRMGTPQYDKEIANIIQTIQNSIGPALGKANKAVQDVQSKWQQKADALKPATPNAPTTQPTATPGAPAQLTTPGASLAPTTPTAPTASLIPHLLKLADKMDEQGEFEIADKITEYLKTAQFQSIKEKGQQVWDMGRSTIDDKYQEKAKAHWNLVNTLKAAYDALQSSGKNMGDLTKYVPAFQQAIQTFQENMKGMAPQLKVLAPAPAASVAQQSTPSDEIIKKIREEKDIFGEQPEAAPKVLSEDKVVEEVKAEVNNEEKVSKDRLDSIIEILSRPGISELLKQTPT